MQENLALSFFLKDGETREKRVLTLLVAPVLRIISFAFLGLVFAVFPKLLFSLYESFHSCPRRIIRVGVPDRQYALCRIFDLFLRLNISVT